VSDRRKIDYRLEIEESGQTTKLRGSYLLIAAGRKPRISGLGLQAAGIEHDATGTIVDRSLRTTARGVYAAGDVVDGPRFHARVLLSCGHRDQERVVHAPGKDRLPVAAMGHLYRPRACSSWHEEQARRRHGDAVRIVRLPYATNDRAQTERQTGGIVKLIADRTGHVLGRRFSACMPASSRTYGS
jgi:pyruvate/2-oxoglutarate dehydrogenase complex dihydrolipoamide dehydrogenase (E3) component